MKYPPPYTKLDRQEMKIYNRIWKSVAAYIGIDDIDNFVITVAAQKLSLAMNCYQHMIDNPGEMVQTYGEEGTNTRESAYHKIYRQESQDAINMLEKAGMLPKVRRELKLDNSEPKEDPIMQFISNGKN